MKGQDADQMLHQIRNYVIRTSMIEEIIKKIFSNQNNLQMNQTIEHLINQQWYSILIRHYFVSPFSYFCIRG